MKGLIGFFDILGYQNFLENNSATESALEVLGIITGMPMEVKEFMESVTSTTRPEDKDLQAALTHLVFSDTIVFTLSYPENIEDEWINRAQTFMAVCSSVLAAEMFKKGLPIRGVIHEGDFITKDMCLAGKGIVEAYQLCESLNFSGVVYSQHLGNKLPAMRVNSGTTNDGKWNFTYLTPIKGGSEIKLVNANWLNFIGSEGVSQLQNDIEKCVLESFWAHQKDCSNAVDSKVRNTVKVIRKMLQNIRLNDSKLTSVTSGSE